MNLELFLHLFGLKPQHALLSQTFPCTINSELALLKALFGEHRLYSLEVFKLKATWTIIVIICHIHRNRLNLERSISIDRPIVFSSLGPHACLALVSLLLELLIFEEVKLVLDLFVISDTTLV